MCLFSSPSPAPTAPTVDPAAERRKAEAEAAAKANEQLLADARRKRSHRGLLSTEADQGVSVLASGAPAPVTKGSTVLGSGGMA
jgi:hypothetical protein